MEPAAAIAQVIRVLLKTGARKATKFLSDRETVKVSRTWKPDRRSRSQTLVVTMGRPNYAERAFLKKCRRAGEPVPVKRVQIKHYPA